MRAVAVSAESVEITEREVDVRRMLEEEALHQTAMAWLSRERGYVELFEDREETTKARLDSIGLIDGRPWFIEVKVKVGPSEALHVESKISGSFRGHADVADHRPLSVAMREIWDGRSAPVVAVVARSYSEQGLRELRTKLERRAAEWGFDWTILRWTEDRLTSLENGTSGLAGSRDPQTMIEEVRMPRSNRRRPITEPELKEIARTNGVGDLYESALKAARRHGFALDFRNQHVTLSRPRGNGWVPILPAKSSVERGLVVGCASAVVPLLPAEGLFPSDVTLFAYAFFEVRSREALASLICAANVASGVKSASRSRARWRVAVAGEWRGRSRGG